MGWTNTREYGVYHRGGEITVHIEGVAFPDLDMAREEADAFDQKDECEYCDEQNWPHEIVWRPVSGWTKLTD